VLEIIILLLFVIVTASALIVLKLGTAEGAPIYYKNNGIRFNINRLSVTGVVLYGISFLIYIHLIAKNDLGYIIPVTTALVYMILFPASHFLFHERFTPVKITGIGLILIGLIFLNLK
jgi:drug/metabolite transporter (DMT)-like permease